MEKEDQVEEEETFDVPDEELDVDEGTMSTANAIASRLSMFHREDDDEEEDDEEPIRCKSDTDPNALGYYIIRRLEKVDHIEIQTIGPQALSKACLAFVQAQKILVQYTSGAVIVNRFNVRKLQMRNSEERTALLMRVWAVPTKFAI